MRNNIVHSKIKESYKRIMKIQVTEVKMMKVQGAKECNKMKAYNNITG